MLAIYARYSTDRQDAASIEDQVRVCRERAGVDGWPVAGVYEDREVSGSVTDRAGYQRLLADARAGRFQIIVAEEVSRLWRSQAEQWRAVEELQFIGVRVIGVRDGIDTSRDGYDLLLAVQGAMNARARRETAWRTHRGLTGRVERGMFAGGTPYGYQTVPGVDGRALEIDPEKAEWVCWIFQQFADGLGCKAIAHELNRRGVPSPRGSTWAVSAIYGHQGKGTGILNNDLYRGRYLWNRSKWVQIPGSRKRRREERPESEWMKRDMPEMRIVPEDLWRAVKARQKAKRVDGGTRGSGRPALTLLSGLMTCGVCGGAVIAVDGRRYGCANHQQRGPAVCDQGIGVDRRAAERELLGLARDDVADLSSPEAFSEVRAMVAEELSLAQSEQAVDAKAARDRLQGLDAEIERLTDALGRMGWSEALQERLRKAETERRGLREQIERAPVPATMIPRLLEKYQALLDDFRAVLAGDPDNARDALRGLLGPVRLIPDNGRIIAEVAPPGQALLSVCFGTPLKLVAGAGFGNIRRVMLRRVA